MRQLPPYCGCHQPMHRIMDSMIPRVDEALTLPDEALAGCNGRAVRGAGHAGDRARGEIR